MNVDIYIAKSFLQTSPMLFKLCISESAWTYTPYKPSPRYFSPYDSHSIIPYVPACL